VYPGTVKVGVPPKREGKGKELGDSEGPGGVYSGREPGARARGGRGLCAG